MDIGYWIGWVGVACGLLVAPPQLYKIWKTGRTKDISLMTYTFLCLALACYLTYAIYIRDAVFITAQSVNLTANSLILFLMVRDRRRCYSMRKPIK